MPELDGMLTRIDDTLSMFDGRVLTLSSIQDATAALKERAGVSWRDMKEMPLVESIPWAIRIGQEEKARHDNAVREAEQAQQPIRRR